MPITIHLHQFDGPLDLLLHLIDRAKLDIKDIFISEITEQYIESVRDAPDLDMDGASEFIEMAAMLLEIKSRAMLPRPIEDDIYEEDLGEALIRRLTEYQAIREAAGEMQAFEKAAAAMFAKLPEEYPLPPPVIELRGLTLDALTLAYMRLMARRAQTPDAPQSRLIRRDEFTIAGMTRRIMSVLRRGPCTFEDLLDIASSRDEVVTLFLALLELLRLACVSARQTEIFGPIELVQIDGVQMTMDVPSGDENGA